MSRDRVRTVMYVDDEPDIREIVQLALGLVDDLKVEICDSGERALQRLPDITPDLVLLDVMMPGTDGPTTLQRMRADPRFANIPVVFVTAKAMPAEVARFRELGAVAVIAKPFDPMQLGQRIATICSGKSPTLPGAISGAPPASSPDCASWSRRCALAMPRRRRRSSNSRTRSTAAARCSASRR
jgi:two-component system OmpR family response regulator